MPVKKITMKYAYNSAKFDFTPPNDKQTICKITKSLGNNTFQVQTQHNEVFIASLIQMFRNNIMMINGSYVLTEPIPEGKKVKAEIVRILASDQIKKFHNDGIWPAIFLDNAHLNNTYDDEKEREKNLDHMKNIVSTRKPLCSATHHLGGSTSVTASDKNDQKDICTEDSEDDMPYIPPNPNLKSVSRFVHIKNDEDSDDEDEDSDDEDEDSDDEDEDCDDDEEDCDDDEEDCDDDEEDCDDEEEDSNDEDVDSNDEDEDSDNEDANTVSEDANTVSEDANTDVKDIQRCKT